MVNPTQESSAAMPETIAKATISPTRLPEATSDEAIPGKTTAAVSTESPVVFFDGVCGLCNHFVNWLLDRDQARRLRFAPLQGATAEKLLAANIRGKLDTLVFQVNGQSLVRSAAVCQILKTLGGGWRICGAMLWLIPRPLRDFGYRVVSRLRYRLFGKHDACRLPTPQERAVFLD